MSRRAFVFCSDLRNYQVFGTFLEMLYRLSLQDRFQVIPLVTVGERDAGRLADIQATISRMLGEHQGYYQTTVSAFESSADLSALVDELLCSVVDIEDLRGMTYRGLNIGVAIVSNLVSRYRCVSLDLDDCWPEVESYLRQALLFVAHFEAGIQSIGLEPDDLFYIYNGRSYNTYPQTLVLERLEQQIIYYERMNAGKTLRVQPCRIHDFLSMSAVVKAFWEESDDPLKGEKAKAFFEEQRTNAFAEKFAEAPTGQREYVVYFVSSEDEYASLDPRIKLSPIFATQREAVAWLISWAANQSRYQLIIRNHPNQAGICRRDFDYWHGLAGDNVDVIQSDSVISSYDLMQGADKVLCFFSTAGIEAAYIGVPSIMLGTAIYSGLDAVYEPDSREGLAFMLDTDIEPKPAANALPYGYFTSCYGWPMAFFERLGLSRFDDYQHLFDN
ncbi:hypothetical protein EVC62_15655 [Salinicola endophyticus]|uniref:Capsule polysaccharide biosynthesis protein n=1 Tax=Salinicola endophyticus TaxID=1949083 RepID=A0ABY8FJ19_9GAMM|nr:hypothetical protein [Salinicola endophyticus]WFF42814.1 hypothetical protein EVC62_15655 [Salinicola endophyticus]